MAGGASGPIGGCRGKLFVLYVINLLSVSYVSLNNCYDNTLQYLYMQYLHLMLLFVAKYQLLYALIILNT